MAELGCVYQFRRQAIDLLVRGYSREEISARLQKSRHNVEVTITHAKRLFGLAGRCDIPLTLVAYEIPFKHDRPLSPYMKILEQGRFVRRHRYVHKAIDLLVRGYSREEIAGILGRSRHTISVTTGIARNKLSMPSWIDLTLLAHDLIEGSEFCLRRPAA